MFRATPTKATRVGYQVSIMFDACWLVLVGAGVRMTSLRREKW